jgi:hypothetical protein
VTGISIQAGEGWSVKSKKGRRSLRLGSFVKVRLC